MWTMPVCTVHRLSWRDSWHVLDIVGSIVCTHCVYLYIKRSFLKRVGFGDSVAARLSEIYRLLFLVFLLCIKCTDTIPCHYGIHSLTNTTTRENTIDTASVKEQLTFTLLHGTFKGDSLSVCMGILPLGFTWTFRASGNLVRHQCFVFSLLQALPSLPPIH